MELIPIKITVRKNPENGSALYPFGFIEENFHLKIDKGIGNLYGWKTRSIGAGDPDEYMVVAMNKDNLNKFIESASANGDDQYIEIIDEDEAEEFVNTSVREKEFIINDSEKLEVIKIKAQAGIALTQEEKDALNPESEVSGYVRNPKKGFKKKLGNNKSMSKTKIATLKQKKANKEKL